MQLGNSFFRSILLAVLITLSGCGSQQQDYRQNQNLSQDRSPASDAVAISETSRIIGSSDLVKVRADGSNVDAGLRASLDAFGLLIMPEPGTNKAGLCSVTHIGNGYALTAGHCFLEGTGVTRIQSKSCSGMKVYWGFRGGIDTGTKKPLVTGVSPCAQIVYAHQDNKMDFALIKLTIAPRAKVSISTERARTPDNTKLTILSYPQGRPLEWSQYCALRSASNVGVGAAVKTSYFFHQCDTEPGSSGSAILAVSLNGSVKIIGIHDAAPQGIEANMGTYLYDARIVLKGLGIDLDRLGGTQRI